MSETQLYYATESCEATFASIPCRSASRSVEPRTVLSLAGVLEAAVVVAYAGWIRDQI